MSRLTPSEFWSTAAQWGSYMHSGDPGVCMYGFNEYGAVQSESHRQACIDWITCECRRAADRNEDPDADHDELDAMLDYLDEAPVLIA